MSDFHKFHNALRILMSIDLHELHDAGLSLTQEDWRSFSKDPYRWFIRASDSDAQAIWKIIEARQSPAPAQLAADELLQALKITSGCLQVMALEKEDLVINFSGHWEHLGSITLKEALDLAEKILGTSRAEA